MKIPLAWLNLLHEKTRSAVAVAGVAFAVLLILMQLGFLGSVRQSATRIYDQLNFDLLMVSPEYLHLSNPETFPQARLYQAASLPGAEHVAHLNVGFHLWRKLATGNRRGMMILGCDPHDPVFLLKELDGQRGELATLDNVLIDRMSRREFGSTATGVAAEVGPRKVRIAGNFALGTGFGADGAIVVGDKTFDRLFPARSPQQVSLGLVQLAPGVDPDLAAEELRKMLPKDVRVFTRAGIDEHEQRHWLTKTSVGIIFGLGVLVALVVGTSIVYQVLSSDIANHLPEYATLKAMGYSRRYLSSVVLKQAGILGVAGFVPGLLLAMLLYRVARELANIPIDMTPERAALVLGLSVAMCAVSGLASLGRVHGADPADLF